MGVITEGVWVMFQKGGTRYEKIRKWDSLWPIRRTQRNPVCQDWQGVGIPYLLESPFCTFSIHQAYEYWVVGEVEWIKLAIAADTPYNLVGK